MIPQLQSLTAFATGMPSMEALRVQVQQKGRRREHRAPRSHLVVHCVESSEHSSTLEGRHVVLSGDKLYVDTGTEWHVPRGHPAPASCFYLDLFPGVRFEGSLVNTTVCEGDPGNLNRVYVDRDTYEVKFGTPPSSAEKNFKGPMDATRQDPRLTTEGWEGFVAVREPEDDSWAIRFDALGDRLASVVAEGTPVQEIALKRVETRVSEEEVLGEMGLESPEVD